MEPADKEFQRKLDALKIDRDERPRERRGAPWLVAGALMLVVGAVGAWGALRPRAALVHTVAAEEIAASAKTGGSTVLNASGYVTARRQATVSSKITGKVVDVLVEEGMKVEKDQVLARLDDSQMRQAAALADAQ